ncbi:hypothetical protein A9Q81_21935 [Gammaproteobacteria bacterium 42_54_T18]|nr:hypothetical protein A9Q81_21935 [Gammaproteobacteria bacterium 42_54_T18]
MNGQAKAKANVATFQRWTSERWVTNDWEQYLRRNQLSRTEIARECSFSVSVLRQNPAVKSALCALEDKLRDKGIIVEQVTAAPAVQSAERRKTLSNAMDKSRIKILEERNAVQRAEIESLKQALKRYAVFDEHLATTGRLIKL